MRYMASVALLMMSLCVFGEDRIPGGADGDPNGGLFLRLGYRLEFSFSYLPAFAKELIVCEFTCPDGRVGHAAIWSVTKEARKLIAEKEIGEAESAGFVEKMEHLGVRALRDLPEPVGHTVSDGFSAKLSVHCADIDYAFAMGPMASDQPPFLWYAAILKELSVRMAAWSDGKLRLPWQ